MTRAEFLDSLNDWCGLIDFCNTIDCDACSNIYSDADYNDAVDRAAYDYLRSNYWYQLRVRLNDLPTDCEYYYRYDDFDWEDADSDGRFEGIKDEVFDFCDVNGLWDEEDTVEDDVCEEYEEDGDDEDDCEEDLGEEEPAIALKEFLTSSIITLS